MGVDGRAMGEKKYHALRRGLEARDDELLEALAEGRDNWLFRGKDLANLRLDLPLERLLHALEL